MGDHRVDADKTSTVWSYLQVESKSIKFIEIERRTEVATV